MLPAHYLWIAAELDKWLLVVVVAQEVPRRRPLCWREQSGRQRRRCSWWYKSSWRQVDAIEVLLELDLSEPGILRERVPVARVCVCV